MPQNKCEGRRITLRNQVSSSSSCRLLLVDSYTIALLPVPGTFSYLHFPSHCRGPGIIDTYQHAQPLRGFYGIPNRVVRS